MKVGAVRLRQYRVPFREPYVTARGSVSCREGFIVELVTTEGLTGLGESAPRPDVAFDMEAFAGAVLAAAKSVAGRDIEAIVNEGLLDESPVAAGIETAAWDASARRRGVRLAQALSPSAAASVAVNALIGAAPKEQAKLQARVASRAGYRAVKLKCGVGASLEEEVERVRAVREGAGPDVALRLDANGAWEESFALEFLHHLDLRDIDYVEQPLRPSNLDAMCRLRRKTAIAIGADEDVIGFGAATYILEHGAADVLVLKPLQLGGIGPTMRIADAARGRGVRSVITTTIDSGIGTAAALHIASALGGDEPAGLATLDLLEAALTWPQLSIGDGRMLLPEGAGLGVELDEGQCERYTVRTWEITA